jgi:hypothetical protein
MNPTQTAHTPGPWRVMVSITGKGSELHIISETRIHLASAGWLEGSAEERANARLIAAAPELLECLQECIEWIDDEQRGVKELRRPGSIMRARKVIAKALGNA